MSIDSSNKSTIQGLLDNQIDTFLNDQNSQSQQIISTVSQTSTDLYRDIKRKILSSPTEETVYRVTERMFMKQIRELFDDIQKDLIGLSENDITIINSALLSRIL